MRNAQARFLMAALLTWSLASVPIALAEHNQSQAGASQELRIGKSGIVTFSEQTRVGDMVLEPGRYEIKHRVAGSDHFIHFTKLTKANPYYRSGDTPVAHPGEIKCALELLAKKAEYSKYMMTREGSGYRITRIEIRGENVAHLF